MDFAYIIPLLALITLLVALVSALWSKRDTDKRKNDPSVPKSSLATDAPSDRKAP